MGVSSSQRRSFVSVKKKHKHYLFLIVDSTTTNYKKVENCPKKKKKNIVNTAAGKVYKVLAQENRHVYMELLLQPDKLSPRLF